MRGDVIAAVIARMTYDSARSVRAGSEAEGAEYLTVDRCLWVRDDGMRVLMRGRCLRGGDRQDRDLAVAAAVGEPGRAG